MRSEPPWTPPAIGGGAAVAILLMVGLGCYYLRKKRMAGGSQSPVALTSISLTPTKEKDLESDDLARLDSGRQSLEAALHQVAEALYKAEAPPAGEGPAGEEAAADSNDDEDVIDAEYTEEKTDS